MLNLRRHEKDFFARKDTRYADKFEARYAEVETRLADLMALLDRADIDRAGVTVVKTGFANYVGEFRRIVELQVKIGLHERDGAYGTLRKAAHEVEESARRFEQALSEQFDAAEGSILLTLYASLLGIGTVIAGWLSWLGWTIS